jgi:hypothetical protein
VHVLPGQRCDRTHWFEDPACPGEQGWTQGARGRRANPGAGRLPRRSSGRLGVTRVARGLREACALAGHEACRRSARLVDRLFRRAVAVSRSRDRACTAGRRHCLRADTAGTNAGPGRSRDDAMWFGAKSMYDEAGFEEVVRRKPRRPVVRLELTPRERTVRGVSRPAR